MSKRHATVSSLQAQLKNDIVQAINGKITDICIRVVRDNLLERVYWEYAPNGNYSYDRTYELLDSVTVGNLKVGYKYATFEIFMDTDKINPYVTDGNGWNQHASVDPIDTSEYIPLWVEEGTSGSLWDRDGAFYMQQSHYELFSRLHVVLAHELRKQGWKVTMI